MLIGSDHTQALATIHLGHLGNAWTPLWPLPAPASWPPAYIWPADQFPGMPEIMERLVGERRSVGG